MTFAVLRILGNPARYAFSSSISTPFVNNCVRTIRLTSCRNDLMEFFEKKENWFKSTIKSGRSWTVDELRIKSNSDLHKLWYILYKEMNMLLTMEKFYEQTFSVFPSPERIDKVQDSMKNLETVVRERNKAYYLLETGIDGEQPRRVRRNSLGMLVSRRQTQHLVPEYANTWFKENFFLTYDYNECREFRQRYGEKLYKQNRYRRLENVKYVQGLLRRFKNISVEDLKEAYPHVDVEKHKKNVFTTGHWIPD